MRREDGAERKNHAMKKMFALTLMLLVSVIIAGTALASEAKPREDKRGILIASFGTSMPEAKKAIDNLVDSAKAAFPDTEVRVAYTSNIIRKKIAREQNVVIPTPAEALAQMNDEGFTHVCVMPMHIIPGEEYDDIASLVNGFAQIRGKYGFKELKLGQPYLATVKDCDVMAQILVKRFDKELAQKGTAIVLMGHGTPEHIANALYAQLQLSLDAAAPGRFFVGTVEAAPTIDNVIAGLKREKPKALVLSPFMIVAGDHANNDLAGADDESWINVLKAAGFNNISTKLVGLGEDPNMAELFVAKIKDMMK